MRLCYTLFFILLSTISLAQAQLVAVDTPNPNVVETVVTPQAESVSTESAESVQKVLEAEKAKLEAAKMKKFFEAT